jgi:hypothetical protein
LGGRSTIRGALFLRYVSNLSPESASIIGHPGSSPAAQRRTASARMRSMARRSAIFVRTSPRCAAARSCTSQHASRPHPPQPRLHDPVVYCVEYAPEALRQRSVSHYGQSHHWTPRMTGHPAGRWASEGRWTAPSHCASAHEARHQSSRSTNGAERARRCRQCAA